MSIAKITEISAESPLGFNEAVEVGIAKASETLRGIRGAWIKEQKVRVEQGRIVSYRVDLKITFVLDEK